MRTKEWADEQLNQISGELETIRRQDGFQDFALDRILQEREKYRASEDELEDLPYGELRDDPLCTCPNSECPIKEGELPRKIRDADDFETGLREFRQTHRGDPVVLREIRDEYDETVSRVKSTLRRVLSALSNNQIPGEPESETVLEDDVDDVDQDELEDEIDRELAAES